VKALKALYLLPLVGVCFLVAAPEEDGPKTEADRLASPTTRFLDAAAAFRYATVVRELRSGQFKQGAEWNTLHILTLAPETEYALVAIWGKEARDVAIQVLDPENDVIAAQWDQSQRHFADRGTDKDFARATDKDKDPGIREVSTGVTQIFRFKVRTAGKYTIRVRVREAKDAGCECSCLYALFRNNPNDYRAVDKDESRWKDKAKDK
jgi:hypothetical protein